MKFNSAYIISRAVYEGIEEGLKNSVAVQEEAAPVEHFKTLLHRAILARLSDVIDFEITMVNEVDAAAEGGAEGSV